MKQYVVIFVDEPDFENDDDYRYYHVTDRIQVVGICKKPEDADIFAVERLMDAIDDYCKCRCLKAYDEYSKIQLMHQSDEQWPANTGYVYRKYYRGLNWGTLSAYYVEVETSES